MFRVGDTILSKSIATAQFACDVTQCKGACCVVGESGAPLSTDEVPRVEEAFELLADELSAAAREEVARVGVVRGSQKKGYEITCVDDNECIFVDYTEEGVAECTIQRAWMAGELSWEKPLSCHLYPIRLSRVGTFDYANFEYIPDLCSAGCGRGEREGIYLSDYLEKPLTRRYGKEWYSEFRRACDEIREKGE